MPPAAPPSRCVGTAGEREAHKGPPQVGTLGARTARQAWQRDRPPRGRVAPGSPQNQGRPGGTLPAWGTQKGQLLQRVTQYQGPFEARHGNSRSGGNAEPRARTTASPGGLSPQGPQRGCTQRPGHNPPRGDRAGPGGGQGRWVPRGTGTPREERSLTTQVAAQSPGTTPSPRTLRPSEPFPRSRLQRAHKGGAGACGRQPGRQARRAISRRRQDTTPPRTGRRSPRARGQAGPPRLAPALLRTWGPGRGSD